MKTASHYSEDSFYNYWNYLKKEVNVIVHLITERFIIKK